MKSIIRISVAYLKIWFIYLNCTFGYTDILKDNFLNTRLRINITEKIGTNNNNKTLLHFKKVKNPEFTLKKTF